MADVADTPPKPQLEEELSDTRMTFGEHLNELRRRLIKAAVASFVGLVAVFAFNQDVLRFVIAPYQKAMLDLNLPPQLSQFGVAQGAIVSMKVSFIVGLIVTAPVWIFQLWAFIGAGLYKRERKVVYTYFPLCLLLFFGGVFFGYSVLLPIGLGFLITFNAADIVNPMIGLGEYLSFFAVLTLVLGATFQLPVIMIGLARTGLVAHSKFREKRRWVILGIFIVSALLTPPDPITQTLLAVPLCILYELGIFLTWFTLGEKREPLNRKVVWKRVRVVLIALGVAALLWRPYLSYRSRSTAKERTVLHRDGQVNLGEMFAADEILGKSPDGAFRTYDYGATQIWVLRSENRLVPVRYSMERVKQEIVDRKPRTVTVFHYPTGVQQHRVERLAEVPLNQVVPALLSAFEYGDDESIKVVRPMLEMLSGEGSGQSEADALKAFRAWWAEHPEDVLRG